MNGEAENVSWTLQPCSVLKGSEEWLEFSGILKLLTEWQPFYEHNYFVTNTHEIHGISVAHNP